MEPERSAALKVVECECGEEHEDVIYMLLGCTLDLECHKCGRWITFSEDGLYKCGYEQ